MYCKCGVKMNAEEVRHFYTTCYICFVEGEIPDDCPACLWDHWKFSHICEDIAEEERRCAEDRMFRLEWQAKQKEYAGLAEYILGEIFQIAKFGEMNLLKGDYEDLRGLEEELYQLCEETELPHWRKYDNRR